MWYNKYKDKGNEVFMYSPNDFTKKLYKTGEVAKIVGLHARTIQGYCDSGKLDHIRSSSNIRLIPRDALITFLDEQGLISLNRYSVGYVRGLSEEQVQQNADALSLKAVKFNPVNFEVRTEINDNEADDRPELDKLMGDITDGRIDKIFINTRQDIGVVSYHIVKHLCNKYNTQLINFEEI